MFGYVTANEPELKVKDYHKYKAYYCGLCQSLKRQYGSAGQLTLAYDMTFVIILLTSLYESETKAESHRCKMHPLKPQPMLENEITEYAADMNLIMAYYHLEDDWKDEKKVAGLLGSMALKRKELRLKGGACFRIALTIHESLRPRSVFVFWTRCCLTRRRVSKPLFDVDHPFGHSPVDDEVVPVDEIVFLVGKEQAGVDDVAGDTHTPGRMLGMIRVGKRFIAVDLYPAGAYGVDRDRRGAQGDGQRVREGDKPPF